MAAITYMFILVFVSSGILMILSLIILGLVMWLLHLKNELIYSHHKKLFATAGATLLSSIISILFALDPNHATFMKNTNLNVLCKTQAVSLEIIYLIQSIVPFLVLKIYKLGPLSYVFDLYKRKCVKNNNKQHYERNKIWIGIAWIILCLTTCFYSIFASDFGSKIRNNKWYECSISENIIFWKLIWAAPNGLLEIYFIFTALCTHISSIYNRNVDETQVIAYIAIRFFIIAWTIPIVTQSIDSETDANFYTGYMSITLIIVSVLSLVTMNLPILKVALFGQKPINDNLNDLAQVVTLSSNPSKDYIESTVTDTQLTQTVTDTLQSDYSDANITIYDPLKFQVKVSKPDDDDDIALDLDVIQEEKSINSYKLNPQELVSKKEERTSEKLSMPITELISTISRKISPSNTDDNIVVTKTNSMSIYPELPEQQSTKSTGTNHDQSKITSDNTSILSSTDTNQSNITSTQASTTQYSHDHIHSKTGLHLVDMVIIDEMDEKKQNELDVINPLMIDVSMDVSHAADNSAPNLPENKKTLSLPNKLIQTVTSKLSLGNTDSSTTLDTDKTNTIYSTTSTKYSHISNSTDVLGGNNDNNDNINKQTQ